MGTQLHSVQSLQKYLEISPRKSLSNSPFANTEFAECDIQYIFVPNLIILLELVGLFFVRFAMLARRFLIRTLLIYLYGGRPANTSNPPFFMGTQLLGVTTL
jgi:hypothetical protein